VEWQKGEPGAEDMSSVVSGSSAVVSCVGAIGGSDASMEAGNGAVNVAIAKQVQKRRHSFCPGVMCTAVAGHAWD
jgi:NAD(P)H-hydrate repair Nnr-like enzyme with NAD(P)H-hydrate dehydratase domain